MKKTYSPKKSFLSLIRGLLFIISGLFLLAFILIIVFYGLVLGLIALGDYQFKNGSEQLAFSRICKELNGQDFTLENVKKLQGGCWDPGRSEGPLYTTCTEKNLTLKSENPELFKYGDFTVLVSFTSDQVASRDLRCRITKVGEKMETELSFYWD